MELILSRLPPGSVVRGVKSLGCRKNSISFTNPVMEVELSLGSGGDKIRCYVIIVRDTITPFVSHMVYLFHIVNGEVYVKVRHKNDLY